MSLMNDGKSPKGNRAFTVGFDDLEPDLAEKISEVADLTVFLKENVERLNK
jgi:hypothetical protein